MTGAELRADLAERFAGELLFADNLDDALIGYATVFNRTFALYDREQALGVLIAGGLDRDEAEEWFDFNVIGSYVGEATPGFAVIMRPPTLVEP